MSEVSDRILQAVRESQPDDSPTTRLATVTAGGAGGLGVFVRFDGEASASTREYKRTYSPASIGDRVLMVRAGSTWVAVTRIPSGTANTTDTGWTGLPYVNGWGDWTGAYTTGQYRRLNGVVYLHGLLNAQNAAVNTTIATLPEGFRAASGAQILPVASPNGTTGLTYIDILTDGTIRHNAQSGAKGVWVSLANISFPAEG